MMAAGAIFSLAAFAVFADAPTVAQWKAAVFFTAFGSLASGLSYRTAIGTSGNVGFLPFMSISLLAPNAAALLAVAVSMVVGEVVVRRPLVKLVFNTSQQVFAVGCAIVVFHALGGSSAIDTSIPALPFVALVAVYFTLNKLAVSTVISVTTGVSTWGHWIKSIRTSVVYDALSMPLIVVFAVAYARLGPAWTGLLVLPTLGIRQLYRTVFVLEKVNEELLQLMVASIEARDPYTSGHSQRVARYAREIARLAGLPSRQIERVEIAALLHDVGKIHEEFAQILRKPGRLSDLEFETMKLHPVRSAELVSKVSHFSDLVSAVRAHHETWDGAGYPDRLSGDQIPLAARIIALADTIDAMTTSRPYRSGLDLTEVRREIERECGRQFDPRLARAITVPTSWTHVSEVVLRAQLDYPAVDASISGRGLPLGNTGEFALLASR